MNEISRDARFEGSIPATYDEHLVPLIFEPFARDLARRVAGVHPTSVLEIAAGTGVLTRELTKTLPSSVRIVATDLNPGMLRVAQARLKTPQVTWQEADARSLPFKDATFDAIACQFGMMFLPDKAAGFREARRVLTAPHRLFFNIWDRLEENELTWVALRAVASVFPDDPPSFLERVPHGYFDAGTIRNDLVAAGYANIEIEHVAVTGEAKSAEDVAFGLCRGTPLRGEIEARASDRLDAVTQAVAEAISARFGKSSFQHRMRALVVTASSSS